ncbi:hypothetical protein D6D18_02052 [Aureobasidium pullulans]|nr:hypothetical protein D6D18_02052 [Aureobasidium pullulans]
MAGLLPLHHMTIQLSCGIQQQSQRALQPKVTRILSPQWRSRQTGGLLPPRLRLWAVATGATHHILEGHTYHVNAVAFSPDEKLVASASSDKTVRLWDVTTGGVRHILEGHTDHVNAVAFSPDSKLVASASGDKTVRLWDVATGGARHMLNGHTSSVTAVAFSPGGKLVASASYDGTIRLWEIEHSCSLETILISEYVYKLAFVHSSLLRSNLGLHGITLTETSFVTTIVPAANLLGVSEDWVTWKSKRVMWLPPAYRASCSDVSRNTLAMGSNSGKVIFLSFDGHAMRNL